MLTIANVNRVPVKPTNWAPLLLHMGKMQESATVAGLQLTHKYIYIYIHITHVEAALCRQHWALGNALPLRHRGRVNAMGQQIQTRCAVNTRHRATTGHSKTEGASTKCVGTSTRYYKFLFYLVVGFNVPHRQPCAKQILTIPARHADRTIKFYRAGGTSR